MHLWNKQKTFVFANSWRRSTVTRIDELFKLIHNKTTPYTPESGESIVMVRDIGNVELFELCETIPKVQCSECLLYWNQGIVHCTCGHRERKWSQPTFSPMATGRFLDRELCYQEGATLRCSAPQNSEAQKEHFIAHNARRRCLTKKFEGIHDRFMKDSTNHNSQLKIGWTEQNVHCDGQKRTGRPLLLSIGVRRISEE